MHEYGTMLHSLVDKLVCLFEVFCDIRIDIIIDGENLVQDVLVFVINARY